MMLSPMSAFAQISAGGGFSVEKSVVANGGGTSSSSEFSVIGTTGQNAAGIKPTLLLRLNLHNLIEVG